jgi:glycosyltransferase involved in cell wall biosynthesis
VRDLTTTLNILQVSAHDHFGGAEAIMQMLHQGYRASGNESTVAFGEKHHSESDGIFLNREEHGSWAMRRGIRVSNFVRRQIPPKWKPLYKQTLGIGFSQPIRMMKRLAGLEDFDHPVSRQLLELYRETHSGKQPDLIHFHTLHGDYFDFRYWPELSSRVPLYVTLHDEWMMTGHCGYALDCERWRTGCGTCPYLDSYPAIARDATATNFRRKRSIYRQSKLRVAAPSKWLLERFRSSPMSEGVLDLKHIPNGIDLTIFRSGDKRAAREILGLPQDETIFLFAASGGRANRYKDYQTIEEALTKLKGRRPDDKLSLVVLGERAESVENLGFPVRFESIRRNPERMALFYQASDLYLHAANAENYPTVILETMACGTPVVATATGGIPEQIEDGVDGFLVTPQNSIEMMMRIDDLLTNRSRIQEMGAKANQKAHLLFDQQVMIDSYLKWYLEISKYS